MLNDQSDIYARRTPTGPRTPPAPPYPTSITAGGTWTPDHALRLGRSRAGSRRTRSPTWRRPAARPSRSASRPTARSLSGTVSTGADRRSRPGVTPSPTSRSRPAPSGSSATTSTRPLRPASPNESQAGGTPATAPTAPTAPGPSSWTSTRLHDHHERQPDLRLNTLQSTTSTTTYTAPSDLVLPSTLDSGNLTLSRGTNTTGRTFNFQDLYVAGNLTLTGPVTVNCTSLYVGGTITINNTTTTMVTTSDRST